MMGQASCLDQASSEDATLEIYFVQVISEQAPIWVAINELAGQGLVARS